MRLVRARCVGTVSVVGTMAAWCRVRTLLSGRHACEPVRWRWHRPALLERAVSLQDACRELTLSGV